METNNQTTNKLSALIGIMWNKLKNKCVWVWLACGWSDAPHAIAILLATTPLCLSCNTSKHIEQHTEQHTKTEVTEESTKIINSTSQTDYNTLLQQLTQINATEATITNETINITIDTLKCVTIKIRRQIEDNKHYFGNEVLQVQTDSTSLTSNTDLETIHKDTLSTSDIKNDFRKDTKTDTNNCKSIFYAICFICLCILIFYFRNYICLIFNALRKLF